MHLQSFIDSLLVLYCSVHFRAGIEYFIWYKGQLKNHYKIEDLKENKLDIVIQYTMKIVNYLDVSLSLSNLNYTT